MIAVIQQNIKVQGPLVTCFNRKSIEHAYILTESITVGVVSIPDSCHQRYDEPSHDHPNGVQKTQYVSPAN